MDELDILIDTTASSTGLEEATPEQRLYDYTNQRETGDASNLYWGNVSRQLTEAQLKEQFNAQDNGQLREAFGSFDNYMAYMNERQDLIDAGELDATWWDTGVALIDPETIPKELAMDDKALEQYIIDRGVELATEAYNAQSDVLNALYSKYTGVPTGTWYNSDGDKFEWNGTSFVKTAKVSDHNWGSFIGEAIKEFITTGASLAAGNAAIGFLTSGMTGLGSVGAMIDRMETGGDIFGAITGLISASGGSTGDAGEEARRWLDEFGKPLITNLVDSQGGPKKDPIGIDNEDGTSTYDYMRLPSLYELVRDAKGYPTVVRNTETGEEYGIEWSPYGGRVILPNPVDDDGGGGGAEDDGSAGGNISNSTGEDITTGGQEVDGDGSQVGAEYSWKYLGDGCFIQVDENGQEVSGTKVCDPDYIEEDYSGYKVGDLYGRGTDKPFGTPEGDEGATTYPEAGTELTRDCVGDDEYVVIADGKGGSTTEVIAGGCTKKQDTSAGVNVTGVLGSGETGDGTDDGTTDGDGTKGTGEEGAGEDGVGDDGTGKGDDGEGKGEDGEGDDGDAPSASGMLASGYKPSPVLGLSYDVPEPLPIEQALMQDWAASLKPLEDRLQRSSGIFSDYIG